MMENIVNILMKKLIKILINFILTSNNLNLISNENEIINNINNLIFD
jgi:hypothetical protein